MTSLPTLHATSQCNADILNWRFCTDRVSLIAKVSFVLRPGVVSELTAPAPIVLRDRHHHDAPARSLSATSDLIPFIPGAEVLVVGHAFSPNHAPVQALRVALELSGPQGSLVHKELDVLGDRRGPAARPAPFIRMPLVWERALRTKNNPVGIEGMFAMPNIVDPTHPNTAAGLGPIARQWPLRRRRLAGAPIPALEDDPLELPPALDFGFFFTAPEDQRLASPLFKPGSPATRLALANLHPQIPRLELLLPNVRVVARLSNSADLVLHEVDMVADRLVLDTDQRLGSLVFRALFGALDEVRRVELGVALGGEAPRFANPSDPSSLRGRKRATRALPPQQPLRTQRLEEIDDGTPTS
ncbi:MAG: DUF2169 domain-containing protein [Polyangiaceae bacterium]